MGLRSNARAISAGPEAAMAPAMPRPPQPASARPPHWGTKATD